MGEAMSLKPPRRRKNHTSGKCEDTMFKQLATSVVLLAFFSPMTSHGSVPNEEPAGCPVKHRDMCHTRKVQQSPNGCEYADSTYSTGSVVSQAGNSYRCQVFLAGNGKERFVWVPLNISVGSMDWRN